jgi:hypothetical protein
VASQSSTSITFDDDESAKKTGSRKMENRGQKRERMFDIENISMSSAQVSLISCCHHHIYYITILYYHF